MKSILIKILANVGPKGNPMAIPSCCELIKKLNLNLTPEIPCFVSKFLNKLYWIINKTSKEKD